MGGILVFSKINYIYAPNNMIKIVNKIDKGKDEVIIVYFIII
ncbi:divergent AAA domain family [Clostridium botulinum C str. Eklund]|nr:divergent AAA domain family [Clostridium botulinum C str. Eklund]